MVTLLSKKLLKSKPKSSHELGLKKQTGKIRGLHLFSWCSKKCAISTSEVWTPIFKTLLIGLSNTSHLQTRKKSSNDKDVTRLLGKPRRTKKKKKLGKHQEQFSASPSTQKRRRDQCNWWSQYLFIRLCTEFRWDSTSYIWRQCDFNSNKSKHNRQWYHLWRTREAKRRACTQIFLLSFFYENERNDKQEDEPQDDEECGVVVFLRRFDRAFVGVVVVVDDFLFGVRNLNRPVPQLHGWEGALLTAKVCDYSLD